MQCAVLEQADADEGAGSALMQAAPSSQIGLVKVLGFIAACRRSSREDTLISQRVLLSWSSGKDSAWTLKVLRDDPGVEVVGLLTTVNMTHGRVAMHSTRRAILEAQARAVGLPLQVVPLPWPCPNQAYEAAMGTAMATAFERGITHIAFGDLFLDEIRAYRCQQLQGSGLAPLFPLWGEPTEPLARRMIDAGMEAYLTCVDASKLPRSFAGRRFDHALLDALPEGVDPCGENGEFHTCVLAGPMLGDGIIATVGEVVERDGFYFADVVPGAACGEPAD